MADLQAWKDTWFEELSTIGIAGGVLAMGSLMAKALDIHTMALMAMLTVAILMANIHLNDYREIENIQNMTRFAVDVVIALAGGLSYSLFMGMMGFKIGSEVDDLPFWWSRAIVTHISAFTLYALLRTTLNFLSPVGYFVVGFWE